MRSKALIFAVALLVLGVGAANAGTNWIGFSGGAGIPTGDFGNAATTGWHIGATGTHMMNDQWGIGADIGYHAWGPSSDVKAALAPGDDISYNAFQGTAHVSMDFPTQSNVKPYVKAGLGLYDVGVKVSTPSGDATVSDSKFGFNFGGGMNFASTGNMRWGVDAGYHLVPDDPSNFDFFTVGVNLMWGLSGSSGK